MNTKSTCLIIITIIFTVILSIKSNDNTQTVVLQPTFVDENGNIQPKCIITGEYNQLCKLTTEINENQYNEYEYKQYFQCFTHAKCQLLNNKCEWISTNKFIDCLKQFKKRNRNNSYNTNHRETRNNYNYNNNSNNNYHNDRSSNSNYPFFYYLLFPTNNNNNIYNYNTRNLRYNMY
jgi:hypothetical protein